MDPQPRQPITPRQGTQARRIRLGPLQGTPQILARVRASVEKRLQEDMKGRGDQRPQGLLKGKEEEEEEGLLVAVAAAAAT